MPGLPTYMEPFDSMHLFSPGAQTSKISQPLTLKKPLSGEDQKAMAARVKAIFEQEEDDPGQDVEMDGAEDEDAEPVIDLEDQRRRTESLKGILSILAQLLWAGSEEMDFVAETIGDGSRDPRWRLPLGDSGVLNFFLEILSAQTLRPNLKIHVLRLIGNSCADTDENRSRVVHSNYLRSIIMQLKDTSLLPFAIPVLYNICIDYEPAQKQASAAFLTSELIELISSPRFNDASAFLGYICKMLDLMIVKSSEVEVAAAPDYTAKVLIQMAANRELPLDLDDFIAIVTTAVGYLQHEKFQKALMVQGAMDRTLAVLVDSYTRFDSHPLLGASSGEEDDEAKALQQLRTSFNQVLSDVSALPEFRETCPVTSPFTSSLRRWLLSQQLQLQVCACIMLGNLARSDSACEEFVHVSRVHLPLITILKEASDSQLLHAALGFLKNLALPAKNKLVLGESGLFDVLPRLWAMDALQQIQFSSISLARQLTIGTFENVRKVCRRLSDDINSPAYSRTNLSLLIALFDRTDVEPIKMEIARLITSVCRVFNSSGVGGRSPEDSERTRISFYQRHPDVGRPLSFMVSQNKWPVVRSEGWFVYALMARYPEGAQCISDLLHDLTVFKPLVQMLTGKDLVDFFPQNTPSPPSSSSSSADSLPSPLAGLSPAPPSHSSAQVAEMARMDRENALVLISELLKNRGAGMAVMRRTLFEDLLKGGSEVVLSYREAKGGTGWEPTPRGAGLNLAEVAEQSFWELS